MSKLTTNAYGAKSPTTPIEPFVIERRQPTPNDILIEIAYCGVCHSDIHTARDEWGGAAYPLVPGHEIVGKVISAGKKVKKINQLKKELAELFQQDKFLAATTMGQIVKLQMKQTLLKSLKMIPKNNIRVAD